jgi:hypothetical protein
VPILYHVDEPYRHEIDRLLQKHPDLKIIFAHFYGGPRDLVRLGSFLDRWPNVCINLAPGLIFRGLAERRDEAREFFIKYQDRILFGTDADASSSSKVELNKNLVQFIRRFLERRDDLGLAEIVPGWPNEPDGELHETQHLYYHELDADRGLYLDSQVLDQIYAGNFRRVVGARPKKINARLALLACEKLIERVSQEPDDPETDEKVIVDGLGAAPPYRASHRTEHLKELAQIAATFRTLS